MPRIIKIEGYCDICREYTLMKKIGSIQTAFYYKCKPCGKTKPRHLIEIRKRKF